MSKPHTFSLFHTYSHALSLSLSHTHTHTHTHTSTPANAHTANWKHHQFNCFLFAHLLFNLSGIIKDCNGQRYISRYWACRKCTGYYMYDYLYCWCCYFHHSSDFVLAIYSFILQSVCTRSGLFVFPIGRAP